MYPRMRCAHAVPFMYELRALLASGGLEVKNISLGRTVCLSDLGP